MVEERILSLDGSSHVWNGEIVDSNTPFSLELHWMAKDVRWLTRLHRWFYGGIALRLGRKSGLDRSSANAAEWRDR